MNNGDRSEQPEGGSYHAYFILRQTGVGWTALAGIKPASTSQHPDTEVPNDDSGAGPWPASRAWPLLPLERTVDDALVVAQQRGYFDDPDAAEPLRWLETCNEQVKDCMAALESKGLRILFQPQGLDIIIAGIGPRGEIYKHGR